MNKRSQKNHRLCEYLEKNVFDERKRREIISAVQTIDRGGSGDLLKRLKMNSTIGQLFDQCLLKFIHVQTERVIDREEAESRGLEYVADNLPSNATCKKFLNRTWVELCRFIPLRINSDERRLLSILERTLKVSEYTDKVDIYQSKGNRNEVIAKEMKSIQSILFGQYIAMCNNKILESTMQLDEGFVTSVFEIARRYKAMNPDRLRDTWVKLMYILQDNKKLAANRTSGDMKVMPLNFEPIKTIETIFETELGDVDKNEFLNDTLWDCVLGRGVEISSESAARVLCEKYCNSRQLSAGHLIIESVKDYYILITQFIDPIEILLQYLESLFSINDAGVSLTIRSGENGARLTHSHSKQYQYVKQSLTLWKEVLFYFLPLWMKAENDLFNNLDYKLADTGQGLNRIQSAPQLLNFMNSILHKVQQKDLNGAWIGSSVIHLGDHNVPNAIMLLDKYCQIPRILGPVAHVLKRLPVDYETAPKVVQEYINKTFLSIDNAQKIICQDFFKHAFDGSGADNYYDAGSCIDGRLTSAWNWCSNIERKKYFPLFLLTNFTGFDGKFGW